LFTLAVFLFDFFKNLFDFFKMDMFLKLNNLIGWWKEMLCIF